MPPIGLTNIEVLICFIANDTVSLSRAPACLFFKLFSIVAFNFITLNDWTIS